MCCWHVLSSLEGCGGVSSCAVLLKAHVVTGPLWMRCCAGFQAMGTPAVGCKNEFLNELASRVHVGPEVLLENLALPGAPRTTLCTDYALCYYGIIS